MTRAERELLLFIARTMLSLIPRHKVIVRSTLRKSIDGVEQAEREAQAAFSRKIESRINGTGNVFDG